MSLCYVIDTQPCPEKEDNEVASAPISTKDIKREQRQDPVLNPIKLQLEAGEDVMNYVLQDGLLYHYLPRCEDDECQDSLKLAIPATMVNQLLQLHHDHALSGHQGSWKTLRRIQRHYTWTGITRSVREYVRQCTLCQKYKTEQMKSKGLMVPRPWTNPWVEISMDLVGPMPKTR